MDRFQRCHANITKLFYLEKSILSRYPLDSLPAQVIRNCNHPEIASNAQPNRQSPRRR